MRFLCENCQAKYSIGDDKIRNRVLKIRCRKCGNLLEVKDPDLTTSRVELARSSGEQEKKSTQVDAKQSNPSVPKPKVEKKEVDLVHWFVGIKDAPFGPISARLVKSHRADGRIDDSNLVWREGMGEWLPLRACKELVGLLAALEIEEAMQGGEDEIQYSTRRPSHPPVRKSVPPPAPPAGRNSTPPPPVPAAGPKPAAETKTGIDTKQPSLLDDLESLDAQSPAAPEQAQAAVAAAAVEYRRRGDSPLLKGVAGGFFALAVVVLVYVVFLYEPPEQKTRFVERIVYRDRLVEVPVAAESEPEPEHSGSNIAKKLLQRKRAARKSQAATKSAKAAADPEPVAAPPSDDKTQRLLSQMGAGGTQVAQDAQLGEAPSRPDAQRGGQGAELSSAQITIVVNRHKPGLKTCYERALRQNEAPDDRDLRADISFTVAASGTVQGIAVSGKGAEIESLAMCLAGSVARWVFPVSTRGAPVSFPLVFTPK